ncbi:MAG: glycosyltransferase family 4 protein [Nanoarchaeota archaeon]|nr:glycosyltransferase family 4 protein [Nanoarchaeota archaeon]MBU1703897.1 glycosyltransferase family 4 protein [Nanoarchaeota archaeon]
MAKKKILFINHEESITGAPKVLFQLARTLKTEYDVAMLSMMKGAMHNQFEQEFQQVLYPEIPRKQQDFDFAKKLILSLNPDMVYGNTIVSHNYVNAAKTLGIANIMHIHELEPSFRHFLSDEEIKKFHTYSDSFIAVSTELKEYLISILCNNVTMINEFIDYNEIISMAKDYVDAPKTNVICIGSLIKRKGPDIFYEVANDLKQFKFTWVGGQDNNEFFKEELDNLYHLSQTNNPYPYLQKADIFVLPSREDPFPLVCLEAMALGKPVIAFRDSGGIHKAISNDCGIILDEMTSAAISKAVLLLIENKNLQKKLGENGRKKVKQDYDIDKMVPKIKDVIMSAL